MRFRCRTCGAEFRHPGNVMFGPIQVHDEDGTLVHQIDAPGLLQASCPVCGRPADAINQHTVTADGVSVTGFADTPEQFQAIFDSLEELRRLSADASLEEILKHWTRGPRWLRLSSTCGSIIWSSQASALGCWR